MGKVEWGAPSSEARREGFPRIAAVVAAFVAENWRYLASIAASFALMVGALLVPLQYYAALGGYGYLGVFVTMVVSNATVILPIPGLAVAWIGGTFLNPLLVGLLSGLGAALGELTGYLLGYGGSALAVRSRYYGLVRRFVDRYGLVGIALFAFVPNPAFDLAGIAAGALRIPYCHFLGACFVGKTLRFVLIAYLGRWGAGFSG